MARKKSIKRAAEAFIASAGSVHRFLQNVVGKLGPEDQSWCYDYAVIRLYRDFEQLMLSCVVGAINNDISTIRATTGIEFPKHLSDEVCEYLVVGDGFFDFKGRDGLLRTLRLYVPADHYLVSTIKQAKYKDALERLSSLRNYAAHGSQKARRAALAATGTARMRSAGSWLKAQARFNGIAEGLSHLASEIAARAPY